MSMERQEKSDIRLSTGDIRLTLRRSIPAKLPYRSYTGCIRLSTTMEVALDLNKLTLIKRRVNLSNH
jgi:hypothetical protein